MENEPLYNYLNAFAPISESDFLIFTQYLKPRRFSKGQVMVAPGQVQRELYVVKSGLQMSYYDNDNTPQVIAFTYAPGLCALPGSFPLQAPADCFLIALTESEVDYLSFEELQQVFEKSLHTERLFRRMTEVFLAGIIRRHGELHSLSIKERYLAFCRRSPHLLQQVPHKYIASYLGIDPSNFSKLYNNVKF